MNGILRNLKKLAAVLQKLISILSITLLMAMVLVMFSQVCMRTFLGTSIIWSEEALRFMFIWLVFLGTAIAVYYNDLSRFELIQESLPPIGQKIVSTLIHLICGVVFYFAAVGAIPLVKRQMSQEAMALPVMMGVVYLVIPICAVISLFYLAMHIILMWRGLPDLAQKDEAGGAL